MKKIVTLLLTFFIFAITFAGNIPNYKNKKINEKQIDNLIKKINKEKLKYSSFKDIVNFEEGLGEIKFEKYLGRKGNVLKLTSQCKIDSAVIDQVYYFNKDGVMIKMVYNKYVCNSLVNSIVLYMINFKEPKFIVDGQNRETSDENKDEIIDKIQTEIKIIIDNVN